MAGVHADTPAWYTKAQMPSRGYTLVENGTIDIGPYGRSGSPAGRFQGDPDDYVQCTLASFGLASSGATFIKEVDRYFTAYPASGQRKLILACLEGGAIQMGLYLEDDGTLSAARGEGGALTVLGTSSAVLSLSTHYRIGFKTLLHASAGTVDVQVQGPGDTSPQNVLALTGEDTLETASATWDAYRIGAASPALSTFQHWVVKDGSGGVHDDLATSPQNVVVVGPIADTAQKDWTPSSGIQNYVGVDDGTADDDVTHNQGDAEGDMDVLQMAQPPDTSKPIDFVLLGFVARNGGALEEVAHVLRQGGNDAIGAAFVLTASYLAYLKVYQTSPDATPWSPAVFAALDGAGYRRVVVT